MVIVLPISMMVFTVAPAIYVVHAAAENINLFESADFLAVAASGTAIALSNCSLLVLWLAGRIKA
jgi:hypothetical protein